MRGMGRSSRFLKRAELSFPPVYAPNLGHKSISRWSRAGTTARRARWEASQPSPLGADALEYKPTFGAGFEGQTLARTSLHAEPTMITLPFPSTSLKFQQERFPPSGL